MNVTIRFSQDAPASAIRPHHHILHHGSELVVDAVTLTADGVEVAGRPPGRTDGKRIVRFGADATVERLPDDTEWAAIALTFARFRGGYHRGFVQYAPAELGNWSMYLIPEGGNFPADAIVLGNPDEIETETAAAGDGPDALTAWHRLMAACLPGDAGQVELRLPGTRAYVGVARTAADLVRWLLDGHAPNRDHVAVDGPALSAGELVTSDAGVAATALAAGLTTRLDLGDDA